MRFMNIERITIAKQAVLDALSTVHTHEDIDETGLGIVGSTYIADNTESDVDVLVLFPMCTGELGFSGWSYGGSAGISGDSWMSWKRTVDGVEVNMLICDTQEYIDKWRTAADVCRFLYKLGVKLKRGAVHGVHEIIMDAAVPDEEAKRRDYE